MKISVKRTLTLLLAAAIYISALTGCSSPLASDQQGAAAGSASAADSESGTGTEGSAASTAAIASGADAANADATSAAPATDTESAPRYDGLPHFEKGMAK